MLPLRRLRAVFAAIWDQMVASDPGLLRLTMAARGTVSVFLVTVSAIAVGRLVGSPPVEFACGITLSMMAPFLSREPTWRQRLRTLVALSVPAAIATVATTVLHGQGPLGDLFFLVLVFLCFLLQARSPRGIGLGLVAVVVSYVGLYLELPPATLPVQLLALVLAVPVTAFACFVVVPLRPEATLRRTVRALQGRAAAVLRAVGEMAGDPAATRRLRRSLARLNEAALAADDQLSLLDPADSAGLRKHIMDLELAATRLTRIPLDRVSHRRQVARLALHQSRLRRNRWTPRHRQAGGPAGARTVLAIALADLNRAAAALGEAALVEDRRLPVMPPVAAPGPGPLAWRIALRVTLASALAMGGGMMVSPQRWFWAVMTTYVVFLGARSRGDTIFKGVERLAGTLLGLVGGVFIASLLAGDPVTEIAVLLAAVFGMYYLFQVSYTLGIFCVTMLLGLLYSLLGASLEPLLVLRLEETAIGAVAAMAVAALVLPVRTRDQVRTSGTAVLHALAEAVRASRRVLAGDDVASPVVAMRAVDRQIADLRVALLPLTAGRMLLRRSEAERQVPALLDSVQWARSLAAAATGPNPDAAGRATLIERRLDALAAGEHPAALPAAAIGASPVGTVLDGLDQATAALAERLAIGAMHGFRL